MAFMQLDPPFMRSVFALPAAALWPGMMLLRADLAASAGQRDEAGKWYRRVLDLWSDADPELQPVVTRIRAALGKLSQPPS